MTATVTVPVEPTREMTDAAEHLVRRHGELVRGLGIWAAMLAVAPKDTPSPSPNELLEAAKEFADAAAKEFNEKGAGGFALARLTDLRTAIRNAEQTGDNNG